MSEQQSDHGAGTQATYWQENRYQGYVPAPRQSGQSIAVLVLGVASLTVFWGIAGIVALCLAPGARREIEAAEGRLEGQGLIRVGVICSWISIALTVLAVLVVAGLLTAVAMGGGPGGGTNEVFTTNFPVQ